LPFLGGGECVNEKLTLLIDGMSCASCSRSLEKALQDKHGVEKASVNFASVKAYVDYNPEVVSRDYYTGSERNRLRRNSRRTGR